MVISQGGGGGLSDGRGRTVLVVSDGIELAVALRDVDQACLPLYGRQPPEALAAAGACRPWPWMVIGDSAR